MSESEWQAAIKFDSTDVGWVIMSIGMAIGRGLCFCPFRLADGAVGLLLSSIVGYPAMYLFQRCLLTRWLNPRSVKTTRALSAATSAKTGDLVGALYFIMLVIWMFVYSTAITNDSASYLHTFGVTDGLLSENPFYGLVLICVLVAISSRGEKLLFKVSSFMVLTKLLVVAALGYRWWGCGICTTPVRCRRWGC
jgi:amino acid permease